MLGHFETIGSISPEKMLGHFKAFDATNYFFMMLALNVYISIGVFIMILKLLEHLCSYFIDPKTVRACWASGDSLYPCKGLNLGFRLLGDMASLITALSWALLSFGVLGQVICELATSQSGSGGLLQEAQAILQTQDRGQQEKNAGLVSWDWDHTHMGLFQIHFFELD